MLSNFQVPTNPDSGLVVTTRTSQDRTFITTTDTDNDGIPDWQEALHRTEPIAIEAASSSYEIPDTLTDTFAIQFFQEMVRAENYGAFGSNPEELAEFATDQFSDKAKDVLYGTSDIILKKDTSKTAAREYANTMAQIVIDYSIPADYPNEIQILRRAYDTNNPDVLDELDILIAGYKGMVERSLATPVPTAYVKEHLDLINVYKAVLTDLEAMKLAFSDPLFTMVRLKRYEEDAATLSIVALNLYKQLLLDGVTFAATDPAAQFIPTQ